MVISVDKGVSGMETYAVVVVFVVPSLCQPIGDAAVFWGSVRTSKPSVRISFVMGNTRYCITIILS